LQPEDPGVTLVRIVIGRLPMLVSYVIAAVVLAGLHDLPVLSGDAHLVAMAPLHEDVVRVDFADDDGGEDPAVVDFDDDLLPSPRVHLLEWHMPAERITARDEAPPAAPPGDSVFRPPRTFL
jgi:hypothetical protein